MKKIFCVILVLCLISALTGCDIYNYPPSSSIKKDSTVSAVTSASVTTSKASSNIPAEVTDVRNLKTIYAFADDTGSQLIASDNYTIGDPAEINIAIGDGGKIYPVRYLKHQELDEGEAGFYDTADYFDYLSGYVYYLTKGTVSPDKTYYLTSSKYFNTKSVIQLQDLKSHITDKNTTDRIEKAKNKNLISCQTISKVNGNQICLVLFDSPDGDMPASIAYVTPDNVIFKDFNETDYKNFYWGGGTEYPLGLYKILFAAQTNDGMIFSIIWTYPGGENEFMLLETKELLAEMCDGEGRCTE